MTDPTPANENGTGYWPPEFPSRLTALLNGGVDARLGVPDVVIADYVLACIEAFGHAVREVRQKHPGTRPSHPDSPAFEPSEPKELGWPMTKRARIRDAIPPQNAICLVIRYNGRPTVARCEAHDRQEGNTFDPYGMMHELNPFKDNRCGPSRPFSPDDEWVVLEDITDE